MSRKRLMTMTEWVVALNKLGGKIDGWARCLHPSVWEEQLGLTMQQYRELAVQPTIDDFEQPSLPGLEGSKDEMSGV